MLDLLRDAAGTAEPGAVSTAMLRPGPVSCSHAERTGRRTCARSSPWPTR